MARVTVKWVNKGYLHHTGHWGLLTQLLTSPGDTQCDNYSPGPPTNISVEWIKGNPLSQCGELMNNILHFSFC